MNITYMNSKFYCNKNMILNKFDTKFEKSNYSIHRYILFKLFLVTGITIFASFTFLLKI